jgi:hypothetical protein
MRRNSLQGFRKSDRKISGGQIYIKPPNKDFWVSNGMCADDEVTLPSFLKLFDRIGMEVCVKRYVDCVCSLYIGFHSELRLPIKDALLMAHIDSQRKAQKIAVNFSVETFGNVFLLLIRLRADHLSCGDKFPHKASQAGEALNLDLR